MAVAGADAGARQRGKAMNTGGTQVRQTLTKATILKLRGSDKYAGMRDFRLDLKFFKTYQYKQGTYN